MKKKLQTKSSTFLQTPTNETQITQQMSKQRNLNFKFNH